MSVSSPVLDLNRLRALVRGSSLAIGLVALRNGSLLELSPAAAALTDLHPTNGTRVEFAATTTEPSSVRQTLALIENGVLDACRIRTTVAAADRASRVSVSLRGISRDGEQEYAIAVFSPAGGEHVDTHTAGNGEAETIDGMLAPLFELDDPSLPVEHNARLADLERRFRRIAHEIDAAGLLGHALDSDELPAFPGLEDLTPRQREILTRLLRGDRVTTISREMHLAASTVRNHLTTMYRKVGVHSQAELIEQLHASYS